MAVTGRADILERLRAKIAAGRVIVGGGAGTGLSAKCEEAGGIDLIVEGDGLELGLLVAWGSTDALRTTTIKAGEPSFIEHAEIRAVFGSTSPNAGYYLADKDITNRNGRPTSVHGRIVKLVFPPVPAAEAVEGEPLSIRVSLAPEQDD